MAKSMIIAAFGGVLAARIPGHAHGQRGSRDRRRQAAHP
jgi:hypothetical protein